MKYYERIKEIAKKKNSIVTSKMLRDFAIPSVYLTRLVRRGKLVKIERGIYTTEKAILDDYYLLYQKNQKLVFSYSSALFLHGLTDRIPYQMEITLPNTYNSSHIKKNILVHKVMKKYYNIGRTMKKTIFGNEVACYNMERTICDLIRFRDKIDVEIFRKAVQGYKNYKDKDIQQLREYAKKFNISKSINELMDVI